MKKITLSFLCVVVLLISNNSIKAQAPTPPRLIYGSSPFQDSLWGIDSTFWNVVFRNGPSLSGFTITGMNGLAFDPTTYETYIIMKVSGVSGRVLGKIDLTTGVCTQVGNLGDNFSSIIFDKFGQLYGATGNGATVPETLYKIDKTTGTITLMYAMGNGADGEVLCYNRADDFIYHWSGNSTMVMEKMARTDVAYTPINIPVTGTTGGETFGAMYLNPNYFLISTIASSFNRVNTTGTYGGTFASLPDDLRGTIMPPQFTTTTTTFCEGTTFYADAGSLQLFDSVIYHWGDGTSNAVGVTNSGLDGASHNYAAGTYTLNILLDNGVVRDTIKSYSITVNPSPVVTLSGTTSICSGVANTLTTSGTGTLQWYLNGAILPGETTNTYTTNIAGVYNLVETNTFGCADSATVGLTLINFTNPVVTANVTADTICTGDTITLNGGGALTYVWNNSALDNVSFALTSSTFYTVVGTDVNGCINSDSILVTVNPLPTVSILGTTSICLGTSTTLSGNGASTYIWTGGPATVGYTVSPTTTSTYTVTGTDVNGCVNSSTATVTVNTVDITTSTAGVTITANATASSYLWINCPSGTSTAITTQSFTPTANGSYAVVVTTGSCSDTSACVAITTIGINEYSLFDAIQVYPNPNNGSFFIQSSIEGTYTIVNELGQILKTVVLNSDNNYSMNINDLAPGVYIVTGINNNSVVNKRVIVTN